MSVRTSSRGSGRSGIALEEQALRISGRVGDRDRYIVAMVAAHRVLTTDQISELAFTGRDTARDRLQVLYRLGLLDRFRPPAEVGSSPFHYVLATLGAMIVSPEGDADKPAARVRRDRQLAIAGSPRLGHLVGLNRVFTGLVGHARASGGTAALQCWLPERVCAGGMRTGLRPDGFGIWAEHDHRVEFFLEYDTGTEPHARLAGKLDAYTDEVDHARPSDAELPWLLICLPSPRREATARRRLTEHAGQRHLPLRVATAHIPPGGTAAEAVWAPLGETRRVGLPELAPDTAGGTMSGWAWWLTLGDDTPHPMPPHPGQPPGARRRRPEDG